MNNDWEIAQYVDCQLVNRRLVDEHWQFIPVPLENIEPHMFILMRMEKRIGRTLYVEWLAPNGQVVTCAEYSS
jgi:hypothetical protein